MKVEMGTSPRRRRTTMATIPAPNATMAELAAESWRRLVTGREVS